MPMDKEEYEGILNELLDGEIEHSRKTELLQTLRVDYGNVHSDFEEVTKHRDTLQAKHDDLVVSNSQLFRKLGTTQDPELNKKEEQKTFSETVRLEDLEKAE